MHGTRFAIAAGLATGLALGAGAAAAQDNPVDRVSNPNALDYGNVHASPPEMGPPFLREGQFVDLERLATLRPGASQADVRSVLGDPLPTDGASGGDWDYDVKFRLPESQNVLVCQYKVRFGEDQRVRETIWRRRQCERLAAGDPVV